MRLPGPLSLYEVFVVLPPALSEFSHLAGHFLTCQIYSTASRAKNRRPIWRIKIN
jgi:hypothetical protein